MGLTDRVFYTTIYVWFGMWCCAAVFVATFFTTMPPMLPSFFPLGNKFLFFLLLWMHTMCCLSIALVFTTISTRKPVVIMLTYVVQDFSILLVIAMSPSTSMLLRWVLSICFPIVGTWQAFGVFLGLEGTAGGLSLANI